MIRSSFLLVLLAGSLCADFQAGLDAYKRGDYAAAYKEWQPIAEKGDPNAQYNLGLLYANGQGVQQDFKQAADWYHKAADQGVAAAQYNLGVMYGNGQGVQKDLGEAAKWFNKAAEKGVKRAEIDVANVYAESGSFQNASEAEKSYRKAAEAGVASAQFNLAIMYDLGQGVQKNYEEAIKWYRMAADQGYASAYTNLGILYYNAQGVKRDLNQAYAWLSRAQKAGDPRAEQLLKATANRMKPKDIQKAQQLAASWQPKTQPTTQEADRQTADEKVLFAERQTAPATPPPAAAVTPAPTPAAGASNTETASVRPPATPAPATTTPAPVIAPVPVAATAPAVQDTWTGVSRVVAVGDIHGDFEQFFAVLRSADLVDSNGNWVGGKAHLVQTGDIVDRGPDSRRVMDLLMKLEQQASAAGGGVHALIGNHEAMDVYGDLRFVSPGEFASYRQFDASSADREISYSSNRDQLLAVAKPGGGGALWNAGMPGFAEHRTAFAPSGKYGSWIAGHNALVKIDDTLFVHAGISPKYAGQSMQQINNEIRSELRDPNRLHGGIATDEQGPLWYDALAKGDEAQLGNLVDAILQNFGVKRIVIGHSYADAAITPRFGGWVLLIDVGLSRIYDNVGKLACLVIENNNAYALHRGKGIQLPKDNGPDMLRYLKQAAAADPQPSPLAARITKLEHGH